jgi:acyl carrier protein
MDVEAIKAKVKEAIQQVTGIDAATISDSASYDQDLGLDSLAILEIAVCVEQHFKFQATDEELSSLRTIADSAELVRRKMLVEAP